MVQRHTRSTLHSTIAVIVCHRNTQGVAFPGEQTIAILSGRTEKTVRQGIRGLEGFPGITIDNYVTKRGQRSKKFCILKPPQVPGRAFPFHRQILESGNWLHLLPSAQALYPVMRCFSFFDYDVSQLYLCQEDDNEMYGAEFNEIYQSRQWDFCEAEKSVLAKYAGITPKSMYQALSSLETNFLIEPYADEYHNGWKVTLQRRRSKPISLAQNKTAFRSGLLQTNDIFYAYVDFASLISSIW